MLFSLFKPLLYKVDAEKAHKLTIKALKSGLLPKSHNLDEHKLKTKVWGLNFDNPIGLAAGFDKNAEALSGILDMGFGFVEVGTVTPKPQDGNPLPRVFRHVSTGSVINRMGFPNGGVALFKKNIQAFRLANPDIKTPIGLNIGMNKDQTVPEDDYCLLIREIGQYADYLTVNVSSPNTPGLRDLQSPEFLKPFLKKLLKEKAILPNTPPLLVKLAPDLTDKQIVDISKVLLDVKIDGVILTNTTLDRPSVLPDDFANEKGGLSGSLVKEKSTAVIAKFFTETKGQVPIVGIGGVSSAEDVIEKMRAGASIVQLYTGLIYHGPALPNKICKKIVEFLDENGYNNISNIVGEMHGNGKK